MDFIKTNYVKLVQRMGPTIIHQIIDELYSKDVINLEEKDVIQCETVGTRAARSIINIMEQKGESACQLFVDCLRETDKFLYEDLLNGSVSAEQSEQNWQRMAQDLKRLYGSAYFQKFHPLGEDIDIIFDLETTFTDALFWKKDIRNQKRGNMTLSECLDKLRSPTAIEGGAGKGKTTLLKRIASLWASGGCQVLSKFKLVFFISLSSAQRGIYDTVCKQLLREPYTVDRNSFRKAVQDLSESVLFLLDGYDEFKPENCPEIEELIKHNFKFHNTVIVSTRTESVSNMRKCAEMIVEIGDLSEENSRLIIANILGPELSDDLLIQVRDSETMKELMKTPLFVVISCAIRLGDTSVIPRTQTVLFRTLYDLMISQTQYKMPRVALETVRESTDVCGDLALDGIFQHCFDFYLKKQLHSEHEEVLLKSGLLNMHTANRFNPVYRFFHKSFQEYVAGRRLHALLTSSKDSEVKRGQQYLSQIDNISDICNKFYHLLMCTCGSSKQAARMVFRHMATVKCHGRLLSAPVESDKPSGVVDCDQEQISQNMEELHKLEESNMESFVACALSFFAESLSNSELSSELESFFQDKRLHISSLSIPAHLSDFFSHLPNCLTALGLIELELFGEKHCPGIPNQTRKTYIPQQAVSLFFDWTHSLNSIAVYLNDFERLSKKDIEKVEKICCSAKSLRLHVTRSRGISGKLPEVLKRCKPNLKDLVIEETPLMLTDEQHIVLMQRLKTLSISNLQTERPEGGLMEGIQNLQNVKKLTLNNIKMTEEDAKHMAKGIKHLNNLTHLHLSKLEHIGNGLRFIAEAATSRARSLEELELVDCCLMEEAVAVLAQNVNNNRSLATLDLSENHLEGDARDSLDKLVDELGALSDLHTLMLPWGESVSGSLPKLLKYLEKLPALVKLGLQKWCLTDQDMELLAASVRSGCLRELQHLDLSGNCVGSAGWWAFVSGLGGLRKLRVLDLSCRDSMQPESRLVNELARRISELLALWKVVLLNWRLDGDDLRNLNKGNTAFGREFQLLVSPDTMEDEEVDEDFPRLRKTKGEHASDVTRRGGRLL
ncbi:NLR family CARD domain-containing protein 4 [Amia ocellicauda]|uniref:NLR family CARD domain-containing protein 4 n=1 Tax=Amia ocellicauda TaxID=2972642 RepID=UPI003464A545